MARARPPPTTMVRQRSPLHTVIRVLLFAPSSNSVSSSPLHDLRSIGDRLHEDSPPEVIDFARWAGACGATGLQNVFLGEFNDETRRTTTPGDDHPERTTSRKVRGLGVVRDIAEGKNVLCMPQDCVLAVSPAGNHGSALEGAQGRREGGELHPYVSFDPHNDCGDDFRQTSVVAHEYLNRTSVFQPYFALLPDLDWFLERHPLFAVSGNSLVLAQVLTSGLADAGRRSWVQKCWAERVARVRAALKPGSSKPPGETAGEAVSADVGEDATAPAVSPLERAAILSYLWMQTRSFSRLGLVPLVDLANTADADRVSTELVVEELLDGADGTSARPLGEDRPLEQGAPAAVTMKDKRTTGVCLKTTRPLHRGEELSYSYGQHLLSPQQFFLQHGFSLKGGEAPPPLRVLDWMAMCAGLEDWIAGTLTKNFGIRTRTGTDVGTTDGVATTDHVVVATTASGDVEKLSALENLAEVRQNVVVFVGQHCGGAGVL